MDESTTVVAPFAKAVSAWTAIGITSWSDVASAAAFLYTLILIFDWCWKKFLRDWLKSKGKK